MKNYYCCVNFLSPLIEQFSFFICLIMNIIKSEKKGKTPNLFQNQFQIKKSKCVYNILNNNKLQSNFKKLTQHQCS